MLLALLCSEVLEQRVRSGAAWTRRAIDLTTFEGEGRRVEGDGEPQQRPTAEARVRTLLEVGEKPGVDSSSFRQLFTGEAKLGPAMSDAAGQVAHSYPSRLRRQVGTFETGSCGRGGRWPVSWSRWCHGASVSPMCAGSIGTYVPAPMTLVSFAYAPGAIAVAPQSHRKQNKPRPTCTVAGRAGQRCPGERGSFQLVTSTRSASVCRASCSVAVVRRACQKPKATRIARIAARTKAEIAAMSAIVAKVPNA